MRPLFHILEKSLFLHSHPRLLLTCEHASNALPDPLYRWRRSDSSLQHKHWAVDLGSEDLTRDLHHHLHSPAILGAYSRLLIDLNRPLDSDTLIRVVADGKPIELNANVTTEEKTRRIEGFYHPFHRAAQSLVRKYQDSLRVILSLHSFTDDYEGEKREIEIGVLHHRRRPETIQYQMAHILNDLLVKDGYKSEINKPWSGQDGFMHSAVTLAQPHRHRIIPLMLEIRQDLLVDPVWRNQFVSRLVPSLQRVLDYHPNDQEDCSEDQ